MSKILIILDGIGDLPCKELNNKTPLEAAKTKNLDFFAKNGCQGYVYPVSQKVAPESDVGVTALLGYDPYKYYTGRGPLEAVGAGLTLPIQSIALRANFATLINQILVDRRAGRTLTTKEAKELAEEINKKVKLTHEFTFKATIGHRGILLIKGQFSNNVSNVDPAYKKEGSFGIAKEEYETKMPECKPLDSKKLTKDTAEIINEFVKQSNKILTNHPINRKRIKNNLLPANFITLRDAGIELPKFPKKSNWAAVVGMPLEKGIAKLSGITILSFEYPEAKRDIKKQTKKSLKLEIKNSLKYIKKIEFKNYYIHIKQTDIPGHDGDPIQKKELIEYLDKKFFKKLRKIKDLEIVVTGDHSTPCKLKSHSKDPVPLLWFGKEKDNTERFTEKESKKGSLGALLGKDVLNKVNF